MKKLLAYLCVAVLVGFSVPAFAMTITPMDSAGNLAQALVGSGITISNVQYTGVTVASGYFTGGAAAGIGIESGIVLTSGYASNLDGTSNTSDSITGDNGLGGVHYLDNLIPGYTTHDATILKFDFVSNGDSAYFNYVFGSDEYDEYVTTAYNDVFGFFFDGIAVSNNVALIPGTTTAVSINNVNNGQFNDGVGASNPQYYNDNDIQTGGSPYPFEYDGFTDVFTASMEGLTAGYTYSLTLAIADAGDHVLDSGVFLQAGSFSEEPVPPIPEPATMLLFGSGLVGLAGLGRKKFFKK